MRLPIANSVEVGCDEVGRGCLFGNVVTAAVVLPSVLPEDGRWKEIRDSKKLSAKKRKELAVYIQEMAVAWAIGEATVEEIDHMNILQATMTAMHRALTQVQTTCAFDKILVDGNYFRKFGDTPHEMVLQGDANVLCIAAASILAKEARDASIQSLVATHPELEVYGLKSNMGYGTAVHRQAIRDHGQTQWHRKSFQLRS
jgi:ribonuclease HII